MENSAGEKGTAKFESLLKWINIYVSCSSVKELSSGKLLLECARKFTPDTRVTSSNSESTDIEAPWRHLFSILEEEFCGCSLELAVNVKEVLSGNQEHIARVIVLLLSLAVQNKNNSSVIAAITCLEYEVQRDLMFFIESTLTKVKSHAIIAGTFTSGVGEILPSLNISPAVSDTSPAISGDSLSGSSGGIPTATPVRKTSKASTTSGSKSSEDSDAFVTPRKPPKRFFNGLDSPAGALLLMSPAITGRRRAGAMPMKDGDDKDQEISRLKHSVRVLEGTLQVEKKLVQEYYEELCSKMEELEALKRNHVHMEKKLGNLQNMADLQDELSHTTAQLATAEKAIVSYQTKITSLEGSREKVMELEGKLGSLEYKASKCEEYKLSMKKSESMLIGKTGDLKRAELQMSKLSIELDAKTAHLETLLQENEEHKRNMNELRAAQKQLEGNVHQLELELTRKDSERLSALEESRDLRRELEILKSSVETKQTEVVSLGASVLAKDTAIVAMDREKVELQKEIALKTTRISTMEIDIQSRQKKQEELENKLADLLSTVETLKDAASMKEARQKRELAEMKSQLLSKESDIKTLENINKAFKSERALLLDTTESLKKDLSDHDAQLCSAKQQIQILEETTRELEGRLHSTNSELELKTSSTTTAGLKIKSLEEAKMLLGTDLDKSKSLIASLEQELASKTKDLASVSQSKKALEARVKTLEQELQKKNSEAVPLDDLRKKLDKAVKHQSLMQEDMVSQLKQSKAKIKALETTKLDQDAVIAELKTSRKSMEEDIARKVTEIATNQGRIKSFSTQKDNLIAEMTVMKKELDEKQDKLLQYESEIGVTDKLKDECSQLKAKNLDLTQWVRDLQSSLDTAKSHNSSIKSQKLALESHCAILEARLTDASRTNTETISEYNRKREQEVMNRQNQKSPLSSLLQSGLDHSATTQNSPRQDQKSSLSSLQRGLDHSATTQNSPRQDQKSSLSSLQRGLDHSATTQNSPRQDQKSSLASLQRGLDHSATTQNSPRQDQKSPLSSLQRGLDHSVTTQNSPRQDHSAAAQLNQAKLIADLQAASMREREFATRCQRAEIELVAERTKMFKLQEKVSNLETQLASSQQHAISLQPTHRVHHTSNPSSPPPTHRVHHTSNPSSPPPTHRVQHASNSNSPQPTHHVHHTALYQTNAVSTSTFIKENTFMPLPLSIREEDTATEVTSSECRTDNILMGAVEVALNQDPNARVKELKRRNKQALPHLKSSYPIEMQVRPETPTTSSERLKGSRNSRATLHSTTSLDKLSSSSFVSSVPLPDDISDLSLSSYNSENSSPQSSTNSPSTSPRSSAGIKVPRKLSNEPQPPPTLVRSRATHLYLREFLDKEPAQKPTPPPSTTFEIGFSPPKVKGGVPKRLQENRKRQHTLKSGEKGRQQQQKSSRKKDLVQKSKRAAVSSASVTKSQSATAVHTTSETKGRTNSLTYKALRSRN